MCVVAHLYHDNIFGPVVETIDFRLVVLWFGVFLS